VDIVVVGAGLGGIASALRLAKLGHTVTLLERGPEIGGALRPVAGDGFTWDAETTALPAVLRDLFRKSGRPLEKELDLTPVQPMREHRFADDTAVTVPSGSRVAQLEAIDEALGSGLGRAWVDYAHSFVDDWDLLRRNVLERPYAPGDEDVDRLLATRTTLHKYVEKNFKDERLRLMALHHATSLGHNPRNVPRWFGIVDYLEQNFGTWAAPSGLGPVLATLEDRMVTRKVEVCTDTEVTDVVIRYGRAVGVMIGQDEVSADAVVLAIDPRHLPATAPYVERTTPAIAPATTHLGLAPGAPEVATEVVLHGDPTLTIRPGGSAPEGGQAWTLTARGRLAEDIVVALARRGIDVRKFIEARIDASPADQARAFGSSYGVLWQGPKTFGRALHTITPVNHLYVAGASATVASLAPFVGLTGTQVAAAIS
jgi:UDP-galactopyranose mutase